ncbi:toprim domain-containing protein [Akkermansiaceae bacterium]|nr:toprim domain-containing protein [Akkermansiaceae bacterium]
MGNTIIGNAPCPACRSKGNDKTGNHLLILESEDTGERFAKCTRSKCGHYISPPEFDPTKVTANVKRIKTPEEVQEELDEAAECPIKELTTRKIKESVAMRFGVRVGHDGATGEVGYHLYPKTRDGNIVAYKVRSLEPKFFYTIGGSGTECQLFGINQAQKGDVGNQYVWIFENELAAMSGYDVLDTYSTTMNKPACVALPDGTGSATRALAEEADWLKSFKNIVLVMDSDPAGDKAVEDALKVLPHAQVVVMPHLPKVKGTDANDYLMAGKGRELFNLLLFRQKAPTIEGLVSVLDCLDEALEKPVYGLSYPWPGFTDLTMGQRSKEIIAVGGGVGIGKTLFAHEVSAWNWKEHKESSFMVMLEETNGDTVKNVAGKIDSVPYHRPDFDFDVERLRGTCSQINDGIHLWRSSISQHVRFDIDKIVSAIRYHAVVTGVKHIFLDNITALTQHLSPTEINTEVGVIASTLAGLADELDLQVFIFSHLNAPKGGASHESGGIVQEFQFTGSRALMRWSQVIIGFERDKMAEGDEKHNSKLRLLKHRKYGTTGAIDTQYDVPTGRLITRVYQSEEDKLEEF